jgi:hypothetical protein
MVETYEWYSLLSIATSAAALGLAVLIRFRHPDRRAGTTFLVAMLCFFLAALFRHEVRYGFSERVGGDLLVWSARAFYFVHMLAVGLTAAFVGTYFYGFAIFRRRGVGTLLYFFLGAAAVLVAALVTERYTTYGEIPGTRASLDALWIISTVYGVLMLATIGRTLARNKDAIVRRQAWVMLGGILIHGATAEMYAYLRFANQFPPPFLTASALWMAAAFAVAILRYKMFEVTPKAEEIIAVPKKFPLRPGRAYLVRERTPELAFRALAEAARQGSPALIVTRQLPSAVREDYDLETTPILYLTTSVGKNHVPPTDPALLGRLVAEFVATAQAPVVALEGIEYLSTYVGFDFTLRIAQEIRDLVADRGGTLLLSANPAVLDERQASLLEREFEPFQPRPEATVEDVFVIHKSGLLMVHEMRRVKVETDRDLMASMLTAIMNFVKVSFAEGSEELSRLELGEKAVVLERGAQIILAVVYRGPQPEDVEAEMRAFLWRAERRFAPLLTHWSGDVDEVTGLRQMTARLFL